MTPNLCFNVCFKHSTITMGLWSSTGANMSFRLFDLQKSWNCLPLRFWAGLHLNFLGTPLFDIYFHRSLRAVSGFVNVD